MTAAPDRPERLYRIIVNERPVRADFESNEALGQQPRRPLSGEAAVLWAGLSVFDSLATARAQRGRSTWIGDFIAELLLPEAVQIRARRTTKTEGHWTIWAEPDLLLASVVAIIDVR